MIGHSQIAQRGVATTSTSAGTSITIAKPTGIAVGDLMIADIAQGSGSNISNSPTLSGWTLIASSNLGNSSRNGAVLYKVAVAADISATNYIFSLDALTDSASGAIIAFSGVDNTTPFDVTPGTINFASSATVTATSLTTLTANSAIVMLGMVSGNNRTYNTASWTTATSPGALTELFDINHNAGRKTSVGGAWALNTTAGSTGNGTVTISGSERNGGILLALKPGPTAPPTITSLGSTIGCVGSSITINGTNFSGTTSVQIGGTPVTSITSNNGTVIVAVIGSGTTGTVSVTTPLGTATSASTFTVNAIPTITSTTPGSRTGTGTVNLNATASAGTISWYAAATGGSALGTGTSFTTPSISATTTYYVETENNGCISTPRTAVVATINNPEINTQGNATSIIDGDITPSTADWTDFGSTTVGVGITRTFTIQNTGTAILNIGAISFSGINASDFVVTTSPSATVAIGGSTTFVVAFTPTLVGLETATISIINDDDNENPYDFALQGTGIAAAPINNNCLGAITLTVNTNLTCTTSTSGTTISATQSQAGCSGTADDDVWYQFVATNATQIITVTPTTLSDAVFQVFSGSCAGLTSLVCRDATTGASVETTTLTTLTVGSTYFVRVYSFASGSGQGTFNICITRNPPLANDDCLGAIDVTINPTVVCTVNTTGTTVNATQSSAGCAGTSDDDVWYKFTATDAGHTITVRPTTLVDAVFQVYSGNCASLTSLACINASTGTSAEATTVNGLTIGAVYYVRVYSNANGSGQGAFTICITSPCTQGSGNSTKVCVGVVAGGLSLNGADPGAINSCTTSTCTNLEANFIQLGNTSTYTVQSIPYVPPYQYTCMRNSVSVDVDDVWSQPVSMPFNFCYYGNNYNNFIISSNGAISFDTVNNTPGGYSAWPISTNVPSATMFLNTIFGVYHDIDPSVNGEIGWELVNLNGGCRAMIISWADVPMYSTSCNALPYTGMVVLYENTNIIEVYIKEKRVCSTWNSGNAVVGIQNATGTAGVVAPNRNSLSTDWTTTNEAWRFLPSGASITTITWYEGSGTTGPVVGNTANINVCPTTTTTYTAKVEYALCNGGTLTLTDPATVTITPIVPTITSTSPGSRNLAGTVTLGATASLGTISWYANASGGSALGTGTSFTTPSISITTTYYVESVSGSCTSTRVPVVATVIYPDTDSDGITDNLDLDDDNDGISDTIEGIADADGDGIINSLDLDSDNDGIGDIIEEGQIALSNGKDTMDLTLWTDANSDGWNDASLTYYASNSPANFDGDSKPNYLDLDSDNDVMFDVDEAGLFNGDGDINCDGKGEGLDSDADGILNVFDSLVGFGNTGKAVPSNTLGSGNPDYLKLSSLTAGVYDISTTLFASLDANNDGIIDGATDADGDGILDGFDTNTAFFGSPRDLNRKLFLDFDGRNDYGQGATVLGGLSNVTLMAWINLNSGFATTGVIAGQDKFHLRINNTKHLEIFMNSSAIPYNTVALNTNQWYHVASVLGGGRLKLYLNGNEVLNIAVGSSILADASLLSIGRSASTATNFFKGKIDEVRVFNVALTATQLQRMVYQEIQNTGAQVRGTIVPKDIEALPFVNMLRYYRMDAYKNDIIDDLTTAGIDSGTGMKIYNNKVIKVQQAPMPFVTERTGTFASAVNSPTNEVRGQDITDYDWSIVQVKHNITETANSIDLGMIVDPSVTITMNNDTNLENNWYLKLDGKIDLAGKSQLVQGINSDLDVASAGSLERDQKGQTNKFNYNYWSSPVGALSTTSNNNAYTVSGVMKDGTTTTPQNINWIAGYNSAATSPISLCSVWIYKFQNQTPDYANWSAAGQNGSLLSGQGYTMKGSDAEGTTQNYTFVGKPNNGTITLPIAANNLNLCGNPYPSALDANDFISANLSSTTGTIYLWEHFTTNSSHNLGDYQGGYATYNLLTSAKPISPTGVSGLGTSNRYPNRYLPVGQGFMVYGSTTGGTITFDNSQRNFKKEDDVASNVMFRQNSIASIIDVNSNNAEDVTTEPADNFAIIRLGYNSANNYHREAVLGFANDKATNAIDPGYDAVHLDTQPIDMYFLNGTTKLVIQGEGFFNTANIYPIGVKTASEGNVRFLIDATQNFDAAQEIYIYDNVTGIYHSIRNQEFEVNLPAGTFNDRFSMRFTNPALATTSFDVSNNIAVMYNTNENLITINNNKSDLVVKSVSLFNILGQSLNSWNVEKNNQAKIQIPINNYSTGTYIVKVQTSNGDLSKKIIIH